MVESPIPNRDRNPHVRFIAMMESGQLVDETAEIVQTQVIAHGARAAIRNRPTVPLYEHLEERTAAGLEGKRGNGRSRCAWRVVPLCGFAEWVPYAGAGLLVILGVLVVILRTG